MDKLVKRIEAELDEVVADIFQTMANVSCAPTARDDGAGLDLVIEIAFHGELHGHCVLAMSAHDAEAYLRAMLGEGFELNAEWTADAVSELCNMIAGGWKSLQPSPPAHATMSPPSACGTLSARDRVEMRVRRCYAFGGHGLAVELALPPGDVVALCAVAAA